MVSSLTCSCHSRAATALGSVSRLHPPGAIPTLGNSRILVSCAQIPLVPPWGYSPGLTTIRAQRLPCAHSSPTCLHGLATAQPPVYLFNGLNGSMMGLLMRRLLRAPARGHRHSSSSSPQPGMSGVTLGAGQVLELPQTSQGVSTAWGELSDPHCPRGNQLRA